MDNKLSELSKPVAWKLHHHDRYYFEENADVVAIAESMGQAKGDSVYSQEYVSALLAELESKSAYAADWCHSAKKRKDLLEDANKRIAELETYNARLREWNAGLAQESCELQAKLATPVRLPDIRSDDYHETGWFQHMKYYRDVERSIRAAGFTVGDE